jgi:hypothetical protein
MGVKDGVGMGLCTLMRACTKSGWVAQKPNAASFIAMWERYPKREQTGLTAIDAAHVLFYRVPN